MINLNVQTKQQTKKVSVNYVLKQLDVITSDMNNYLVAAKNLIEIKQSLKKYGKTPQLTELVGASLESAGITFSIEGIGEKIASFFKMIKEKIIAIGKWFLGLFGFFKQAQKKSKDLKVQFDQEVKAVKVKNTNSTISPKGEVSPNVDNTYDVKEFLNLVTGRDTQINRIQTILDANNLPEPAALGDTKNLRVSQAEEILKAWKRSIDEIEKLEDQHIPIVDQAVIVHKISMSIIPKFSKYAENAKANLNKSNAMLEKYEKYYELLNVRRDLTEEEEKLADLASWYVPLCRATKDIVEICAKVVKIGLDIQNTLVKN